MNFIDDGTDEVYHEQINQTIIDRNDMWMYLIIIEGNYGAIDADDYTCHVYYIIIFTSSPYTFQADLSKYGQVISSGEIVCEGTYFLNQYQLSLLYFSKK